MSEVYLVPVGLDPDAQAGSTAPTEPISTYDELITGKQANAAVGVEKGPELPEVEIHEYRLMKTQLAWLATARLGSSADPLAVPAISGAPVITCDNSRIDRANIDDEMRRGIVYSVPVHDEAGRLIGCISGVILNEALRDLLGSDRHALVFAGGTTVGSRAAGAVWAGSIDLVAQGRPDPRLAASSVMPIAITDGAGPWGLWSGHPEADFAARPDVQAGRKARFWGIALVVTGSTLMAAVLIIGLQMQRRRVDRRVDRLLASVSAAAAGDLTVNVDDHGHDALGRVAAGVRHLIAEQRQGVALMQRSLDSLTDAGASLMAVEAQLVAASTASAHDAEQANGRGKQAAQHVGQLAAAIEELNASAQEIAQSAQRSAGGSTQVRVAVEHASTAVGKLVAAAADITSVVKTIRDIAEQTNLLALNASIEASRAGEAGRAFTVVAGEVKALARQAAGNADGIGRLVAGIGTQVEAAVTALQDVSGSVIRIAEDQHGIAAVTEQQSATAGELARSAGEASRAGDDVAQTLAGIEAGARHTATQIARLRDEVARLRTVGDSLRAVCGRFRTA